MRIAINRKSPFGIKDQIKRQIRILVESGDVIPGKALPSIRDMAQILNVNRNTVSAAYREMTAEGLLEIIAGSGTYVKNGNTPKNIDKLSGIFNDAVKKATSLGLSFEQISDYFLNYLSTYSENLSMCKVLVVDCNLEAIDHISKSLQQQLGVKTEGVLIQNVQENPEACLPSIEGKDLIVCGFNHVEEFKKAIPISSYRYDIVGVVLNPDIRIINVLVNLPPGTHVGYTGANQRSRETLFKIIRFSKGGTLTKIWAGLDSKNDIQNMLERCEVIFATAHVFNKIKKLSGPDKRVIKVDFSIDTANIELIRERLRHHTVNA
jgi:GntR family transcriptional regulator